MPSEEPVPRPRPASPSPAPPERTVLVVDDLPDAVDLWRGLARRVAGARVRVVAEVSGERALALVARRPFDLVVSDYQLGKVDGVRILEQARRTHPEGRRALVTGRQEVPVPMDRVRNARIDAYLAKPFDVREAVSLLDGLLAGHPVGLAVFHARARLLEAEAEAARAPLRLARPSALARLPGASPSPRWAP